MDVNSQKKADDNARRHARIYLETHWPYRKSQSSWAGGDHHIIVHVGKEPYAEGYSTKEWSRNGKWCGNDSHADLTCTRRTLQYFPTLTTPDGLIVLDAKKIGHREYQITWVEQARGFGLNCVEGYLIRGYHVAATSPEKARKKASVARKKAFLAQVKIREEKNRNREEQRTFWHVWVGFDDSIQAGNCRTATENFLSQIKTKYGNIGGVRADFLLSIRDDQYVRRAIAVASQRLKTLSP